MISFRAAKLYLYIILCGIVLITFLPCVGNQFVDWDDMAFVVKNYHISYLSLDSLYWMLTTNYQGVWHPLTWFSHGLDRALWGLRSSHHHLVNVILHTLNVLVFCFLVVKLQEVRNSTEPDRFALSQQGVFVAAFTAALLFGLHPLRVESVAWLSERKDVLCSFFFLTGLTAYLSYASASTRAATIRNYLLCVVLHLLALLSKPTAVTFPFVLLLLDYYPLRRLKWTSLKTCLIEKIPFFVLTVADVLINIVAREGAAVPFSYVPLYMRVMNAFYAMFFYIRETIFPTHLIPLYQLDRELNYFGPIFLLSMAVVLAVTAWCLWRAYKDDRLWAAVWFYYIITLAPMMGFYMVFRHAVADRYTYLTTLGFWILIGLGGGLLWDKAKEATRPIIVKLLVVACVVILATCYGLRTQAQIAVWKNTETLWTYVITRAAYVPAVAYFARGKAYEDKGELQKALAHYHTAFSLNPKNNKYLNRIAGIYVKQKDYDTGLKIYSKILKQEPKNPRAHIHVGRVLALKKKFDQAQKHFEKAMELDPELPAAYLMTMLVHVEKKNKAKAMEYYRKYKEKGLDVSPAVASKLGITSIILKGKK
jgi:tetratricopeptide (TPR) repeat protein